MPNMSYCRFRNTLIDLLDCEQYINRNLEDMDEEERIAHDRLIDTCERIARENEEYES